MGVCLPGANNVMSRTHLKQDARTLSRSLARSLPLSLSLSRSLSPRSLARSLGVCVHARMRRCVNEAFRNGDTSADVSRSQSHKTRAFRDVAHQQMFRAIVDAGCRTTPPRMLCLECSACACVCALSCAVINYLHPPLECSVLLCMRMRMLENALSFY